MQKPSSPPFSPSRHLRRPVLHARVLGTSETTRPRARMREAVQRHSERASEKVLFLQEKEEEEEEKKNSHHLFP